MRKETDLAKVKQTARMFLASDIQLTDHSPVVVSHPFTSSGIVGFRDGDGEIVFGNLIEKPDDLARWRRQVGEQIGQADSAFRRFLWTSGRSCGIGVDDKTREVIEDEEERTI